MSGESAGEPCAIQCKFLLKVFDYITWSIGCEHRELAIVTENWRDESVTMTLILEDERFYTVMFTRGDDPHTLDDIP